MFSLFTLYFTKFKQHQKIQQASISLPAMYTLLNAYLIQILSLLMMKNCYDII